MLENRRNKEKQSFLFDRDVPGDNVDNESCWLGMSCLHFHGFIFPTLTAATIVSKVLSSMRRTKTEIGRHSTSSLKKLGHFPEP